LYGISSFKPDYSQSGITVNISSYISSIVRNSIAPNGGVPLSKVYKNFAFTHRTENTIGGCVNSSCMVYGVEIGTKSIDVFLVKDKKSIDIAKKIDLKFDDGAYNDGNIRGYCNDSITGGYNITTHCGELYFYLEIK
jgi:hypothetical protein